MPMDISVLEKQLGHQFADPQLLERALTHRSWTHENRNEKLDNESFEFVGDSVLGLAIAEQLFAKHPDLKEGDLTLMKHRLVSAPTLSGIAVVLGLTGHLRMGRGEEKSGGREKPAIAADALEAVIAAIFFDGGYSAARSFIARIFADQIESVTPRGSLDHKTTLQEVLQANKMSAPTYSLLNADGPPHDRTFFVEAVWANGRSEGTGRSLKLAEMNAAAAALKMLSNG
jgi:ribonuclease III, bacterial